MIEELVDFAASLRLEHEVLACVEPRFTDDVGGQGPRASLPPPALVFAGISDDKALGDSH